MRLKLISVLLIFLLCISSTACSSAVAVNGKDPAIDAYKNVLENKAAFVETTIKEDFTTADKMRKFYLNDFLNGGPYGTNPEYPLKIRHFAVVDMDGDKIPEVVLELKVGGEGADFREVLHYYNGEVYGYFCGIRSLSGVKADGTFGVSGGAGDWGFEKLRFTGNTVETVRLGDCQSNSTQDVESYFVNDKPVTEEAFQHYVDEQGAKEDVVWYEFSQENIETQLSDK